MKKINFDFLKDMEVKEIEKSPVPASLHGKTPAPGAHLRLFSDGSIFPSDDLIKLHHLEYQPKGTDQPENGYDVFLSTDWSQFTGDQVFVCINPISKHEAKVDIFSTTKYKADGTPKASVVDQKTKAGEKVIELLEKCLEPNESLFGTKTFVDLKINLETPIKPTATGIYNLPKPISRGKDAGKPSYIRRENITIYPLVVVESQVEAYKVGGNSPQTRTTATTGNEISEDAAKALFNN